MESEEELSLLIEEEEEEELAEEVSFPVPEELSGVEKPQGPLHGSSLTAELVGMLGPAL